MSEPGLDSQHPTLGQGTVPTRPGRSPEPSLSPVTWQGEGQLWLSPLPEGLTGLRERRAGAQLVEPWLSYSIAGDPVAFVIERAQPWGWRGWTPPADLSRGTDTAQQGPSPGKFVEDG